MKKQHGSVRRLEWRHRGPTLKPGLGLGLTARTSDMGTPSSRLTNRRRVQKGPVQCDLGGSHGQGPNPRTVTLVMGIWSPHWGGKSVDLVREVEWYWLEIVRLTSTNILGSGIQLLERSWTLFYSRVAYGELVWACWQQELVSHCQQ